MELRYGEFNVHVVGETVVTSRSRAMFMRREEDQPTPNEDEVVNQEMVIQVNSKSIGVKCCFVLIVAFVSFVLLFLFLRLPHHIHRYRIDLRCDLGDLKDYYFDFDAAERLTGLVA